MSSVMASTFLYFAYGSNMLSKRIHINNPTAIRKGTAILKNYRLDFSGPISRRWGGCSATIVPDNTAHVWGALWEINVSNKSDLDKQEGVSQNIYFPIEVDVVTSDGQENKCRCYQMYDTPPALSGTEVLPNERRPSKIYLEVIIRGARESGLPDEYVKALERIPHNGHCQSSVIDLELSQNDAHNS